MRGHYQKKKKKDSFKLRRKKCIGVRESERVVILMDGELINCIVGIN